METSSIRLRELTPSVGQTVEAGVRGVDLNRNVEALYEKLHDCQSKADAKLNGIELKILSHTIHQSRS